MIRLLTRVRSRVLMTHLDDDERRMMWRLRACTTAVLVAWLVALTFLYSQFGGSILP